MTREQLDDALRALEHLCDGYCGTKYAAPGHQCNGCRVGAALVALTEWRPMQTAPRDGTVIFARRRACGEAHLISAIDGGGWAVVGWKATADGAVFAGWLPLVPGPVTP